MKPWERIVVPDLRIVPPWGDPRAIMAYSAVRVRDVSIAFGAGIVLAKADPKRIAIGVGVGLQAAGAIAVGPTSDPASYGFQLGANQPWGWWSLFEHGPLVTLEWRSSSVPGTTVAVYEWYLT